MKKIFTNAPKAAFMALAFATVAAPQAQAKEYTYKCTATHFDRGGWVLEDMILAYDDATLVASAYDGLIHSVHKAPIPVDLKKESDIRYRFRWKIEVTPEIPHQL